MIESMLINDTAVLEYIDKPEQKEEQNHVYKKFERNFGEMESKLNTLEYALVSEKIAPTVALSLLRELIEMQMKVIEFLDSINTFEKDEYKKLTELHKNVSERIRLME